MRCRIGVAAQVVWLRIVCRIRRICVKKKPLLFDTEIAARLVGLERFGLAVVECRLGLGPREYQAPALRSGYARRRCHRAAHELYYRPLGISYALRRRNCVANFQRQAAEFAKPDRCVLPGASRSARAPRRSGKLSSARARRTT